MKKFFCVISVIMIAAIHASAQITCTVKGKVINRPQSTVLMLAQRYGDPQLTSKEVEIKDSTFSFTISATEQEVYKLIFKEELDKGSWRHVEFCTVDGEIVMELYPMDDYMRNKIIGGAENKALTDFNELRNKMYETRYEPIIAKRDAIKDIYSDLGLDLQLRLDTTVGAAKNDLWRLWYAKQKTGEMYIPEVRRIKAMADSAVKSIERDLDLYTRKNPSLSGYYDLRNNLVSFKTFEDDVYTGDGSALDFLENKYKCFAKAYPNHSNTKICREMINNLRQIRVGGKYIDFSAPDLDGNMVKLSTKIKGKIALIDLWASWCGPCRNSSISFIPIYDEYKERGFTIVGVARERDDDKSMRKAIEKDGYKWLNLLELNDSCDIWNKYGIGNAAGGVYMVDGNSTILAINPNASEVREILKKKIK